MYVGEGENLFLFTLLGSVTGTCEIRLTEGRGRRETQIELYQRVQGAHTRECWRGGAPVLGWKSG